MSCSAGKSAFTEAPCYGVHSHALSIFLMIFAGFLATVCNPFDAVDQAAAAGLLSWAWRVFFLVVALSAFAYMNCCNLSLVALTAADNLAWRCRRS